MRTAPAFAIDPPHTGAEILSALRTHRDEAEAFFSELPLDEFLAPQGDRWSPADHLRHLAKSVRPVANALRLPRFVLGVLFGRAVGPGRAFEPCARSTRGSSPMGPKPGGSRRVSARCRPRASEQEAYRRRVMEHWRAASQAPRGGGSSLERGSARSLLPATPGSRQAHGARDAAVQRLPRRPPRPPSGREMLRPLSRRSPARVDYQHQNSPVLSP